MVTVFLRLFNLVVLALVFLFSPLYLYSAYAKAPALDSFYARPPIHIRSNSTAPQGLTPDQVKKIYHLPGSGGFGTIAIVGAFDDPSAESDLNVFSRQFNLPECTSSNGCFEKHKMSSSIKSDSGWEGETSLDTQWAHAIAPGAKILLVEAKSSGGKDLLSAVDYAKSQRGVVSVSMSWGGGEFAGESSLDSHFKSSGIVFFASSGDSGFGVEWPAVSPNVIGVGGTTLHFGSGGALVSETAWSGSGGGVSSFISEPTFQKLLNLKKSGKRAVPDVSFGADPNPGFSIYHNGWMSVGGTSAGAPQWAALHALGKNFTNLSLYKDASSKKYSSYFRDIIRGINGDCGKECKAGKEYDTVTGLGSPLTTLF